MDTKENTIEKQLEDLREWTAAERQLEDLCEWATVEMMKDEVMAEILRSLAKTIDSLAYRVKILEGRDIKMDSSFKN